MAFTSTGPPPESYTYDKLVAMAKRLKDEELPEPKTPSEHIARALVYGVPIRNEHPLMPGRNVLVSIGGNPTALFVTQRFMDGLKRSCHPNSSPSSAPTTKP